jgi:predicted N-acetyltransferase YhbS
MQIRAARSEEAAELTLLARTSKASWGYPVDWLQEWAEELTITPDYLATAEVLVATPGSGIAGMIAVHEGEEGPEIEHLWVSPEMQGRGIGLALVRRAMQHAEEKGWTRLRIVSDPNAEEFYERLGATRVGDVGAPVAGVDRRLPVLSLPVASQARAREVPP